MASPGYKMVAVAICPTRGNEFWLLDEPVFDPGSQPAEYPGKSSITFICCDTAQSVPPSTIVYRLRRIGPKP
jgi:hypothetical protein